MTALPTAVKTPQETRSVILQVAAQLLREHGYAAVTMRQIASDAKIKAGSIYCQFESKEEILFHVLDEGLRVIVCRRSTTP